MGNGCNAIMKTEDAAAFRRRSVSIAIRSACLLCLGLVVLLSQGCAKERGITPVPTKYRAVLLTADRLSNPEYIARVLDLSTGEVAGEVPVDFGGGIPADLTVTPDGQYCATSNRGGNIKLIDLQSMTVADEMNLTPIISSLHFLPVGSLKLLVSCGTWCTSAVYDLSMAAVDTVLPGTHLAFSSPDQSELVTILGDQWLLGNGLIRRSYGAWGVVDSFSFVSPGGYGVAVREAEVSPAYDGIFLLGHDEAGDAVFFYNFSDRSCAFRQPILPARFAVSPDGREIWVLQSGGRIRESPFGVERWEYILILDGSTGVPLDTIKTARLLEQYPEYPSEMIGLRAIEFHPDEPVVYIVTQSSLSMLVMNRTTRAVIGTLDVGIGREIVISPTRNTSAHAE